MPLYIILENCKDPHKIKAHTGMSMGKGPITMVWDNKEEVELIVAHANKVNPNTHARCVEVPESSDLISMKWVEYRNGKSHLVSEYVKREKG